MGVNSLPKTVTRQRRDCDLNPGPSAPESSTLTTRLPSHPRRLLLHNNYETSYAFGFIHRNVKISDITKRTEKNENNVAFLVKRCEAIEKT